MKRVHVWLCISILLFNINAYADEIGVINDLPVPVSSQKELTELKKQRDLMVSEEKKFCDEVLAKITATSTKADVMALLGEPSRDITNAMGSKQNWWVTLGGKQDRVGVYFSPDGKVTGVVLDGGSGGFYYRYNLR